jgi:hypothetical protein
MENFRVVVKHVVVLTNNMLKSLQPQLLVQVRYANRLWEIDMWEGTANDHYVLTSCDGKYEIMHTEIEREELFMKE